jgi:hypothetical protein
MIITDYLRQKLVDKLGGWQSATACHFNSAVYKAKCRFIDNIDEIELAKASFKGVAGKGTPKASAEPAQQEAQLVSLDDII